MPAFGARLHHIFQPVDPFQRLARRQGIRIQRFRASTAGEVSSCSSVIWVASTLPEAVWLEIDSSSRSFWRARLMTSRGTPANAATARP